MNLTVQTAQLRTEQVKLLYKWTILQAAVNLDLTFGDTSIPLEFVKSQNQSL